MNAHVDVREPYAATLERRMARTGARVAGVGATAFVMTQASQPDRVVKVGYDVSDPWPIYAAWCRPENHPTPMSPHLPVIHEFHNLGGAEHPMGYAAVVERLHPCARSVGWTWTCEAGRRRKHPPLVFAALVESEEPGLAAIVRRLVREFPMARWDLAASNLMQRADGTVVLTDPWK